MIPESGEDYVEHIEALGLSQPTPGRRKTARMNMSIEG
jgi:hypothetical protein